MVEMNFTRAAGAYNDALRAAQSIIDRVGGPEKSAPTTQAQGSSFLDMVGSALQGAAASGYKSETMAMNALSGKADLTDVVTAVSEAETALNTVVAIRDRVINAYQDIIKMPI